MKKINIIIGIAIALLLTAAGAGAVATTCTPDGRYCGTLEGTYTSPDLPGQTFQLYASFEATMNNGIITFVNIDPTGSNPAIDDLAINAIYNSTSGLIEVTASGICMSENQFTGFMEIDPCNDFGVIDATGSVNAVYAVSGLTGDFKVDVERCGEIPEFPTVALPMIAILGLAFVMQRRKD